MRQSLRMWPHARRLLNDAARCAVAIAALGMPCLLFAQETAPTADATQSRSAVSADAPAETGSGTAAAPAVAPTIPVQTPESDHTLPSAADKTMQLEDVVVTATKREKSVREIPASIDAFTGKELVDKGATSLEEIIKLSPSVQKSASRVIIRAVGTTAIASFVTTEEVGRLFGDVSMNAPSVRGALADLEPYDMETIEVLKGPQGTLFGGTALAGAIRYVPNKPDLNGYGGSVRAGIGKVADADALQKEVSAMFNVGFADTVGLRAVGTYRTRPGAIDDLYSGKKDIDTRKLQQVRALAAWKPSDDLHFDLTWMNWQDDFGDIGFTDRPDRYETRLDRVPQTGVMKARILSLRGEYDWDAVSVVGLVNHLKQSWGTVLDLAPLLGTSATNLITPDYVDTQATVPSYELRLVSRHPSESGWAILRDWDYLAGLYLMKADQGVISRLDAQFPTGTILPGTILGIPLPPTLPGSLVRAAQARAFTNAEEQAFFFDLTRPLLDKRLEINLGGRLARTKLDIFTDSYFEGQSLMPESKLVKDNRFNPKAALTWHFSKTLSAFVNASQGFRFGGGNANATAAVEMLPRTFKSDSLWNYEVGMRSDWLDRTLRFDVTAFRIDWKDLQVTQISKLAQNFVSNVGGAQILGVESQLLWRLPNDLPIVPQGLTLNLSGSYIDSRTTADFASENGPVPAGTRLPLTPRASGLAAINWSSYWGSWLPVASLSNAFGGRRKNELIDTVPLPGYALWNASFNISNLGWSFAPTFSLTGTNLLNKTLPFFGYVPTLGSERVYVLNRPRTLMLNLEAKF